MSPIQKSKIKIPTRLKDPQYLKEEEEVHGYEDGPGGVRRAEEDQDGGEGGGQGEEKTEGAQEEGGYPFCLRSS